MEYFLEIVYHRSHPGQVLDPFAAEKVDAYMTVPVKIVKTNQAFLGKAQRHDANAGIVTHGVDNRSAGVGNVTDVFRIFQNLPVLLVIINGIGLADDTVVFDNVFDVLVSRIFSNKRERQTVCIQCF